MPVITTAEKQKYDSNFDENQVEELIREFQTVIEYDLIDEKKATRAECITTFKMLPNFDWSKNDNYHIRDTTGNKIVMITYFADGAIDEITAGPFFNKEMSLAT